MATTATDRIGSYVLDGELGRGAFGVVYRAHHGQRPQAPVALKVVENRGNLDRLMLEPALLSKLHHPCIVRLEDYFLDEDRLVLALEFVQGEDLKVCVDRGETFAQEQVRDLLVQMAGALAEAHAHNVVHRDIKLSNILVDRSADRPRFVLTDFGVGRAAEGIQAEKHTGGTYLFMAPEQLRGRPCPQSDLWALGVVAYRLLTGQMPFNGPNLPELSSQIFYATPTAPSKCTAEPIDAELEAVVFRLLEKSLTERTASAAELLRELGHRDAPGAVVSRPSLPPAAPQTGRTLDERIGRRIIRLQVLAAAFAAIYIFQKGLFSGLFLLAGLALFYLGCQRDRWPFWLRAAAIPGALSAMTMSACLPFTPKEATPLVAFAWLMQLVAIVQKTLSAVPGLDMVVGLLAGAVVLGYYLLAFLSSPVAAYCLSALRRQQRTRAMRRAALEAGGDPEIYLDAMKGFLDDRFEDVSFHLKYAEALLARGRLKEVAVEAKILLRQDPYNFNGNLLLANAYSALGLLDDCVAVCDAYLAVAGYCFEFSELKQQCLRKQGAVV